MVCIAVLGCGLLGVKIAGEMAYHGHKVKLYDNNLGALNAAYDKIEEDKEWMKSEGLLTNNTFIGHIYCLSRLEDAVKNADFVFEAVIDDLPIKQDLFERVTQCCPPNCIVATNTLRLDVTSIVERATNKERTIGLRFLFPVYYIPEVEITPGRFTSGTTIETVRQVLENMGKTLFFRSGSEPLVLSEEQREERKKACIERMKENYGVDYVFSGNLPALGHRGSIGSGINYDQLGPNSSDADRDCAICMDRTRDCLLCPCHHMVTCTECAKSLLNRRDGCPICRTDITEMIRVFHS